MDKLRKSKTLKKLRTLFGQSKRTRGSAPRSPVGTSCDVVEVWLPDVHDLSSRFIYHCFYYGRGRYQPPSYRFNTSLCVYLRLLVVFYSLPLETGLWETKCGSCNNRHIPGVFCMGSSHFTDDSGMSHDLLGLSCDSLTVSRDLVAVL